MKQAPKRKRAGKSAPAAESRASLLDTSGWLYDALAGPRSVSGEHVNEVTALNLSVVWACVRVISETVGSLPWLTYGRGPDGGRERLNDHELYAVLHDEPNADMTAFTLKETLVAHALLWGNGYAEIIRDAGDRVAGLYPLRPDLTTPKRRANGALYYEVRSETGGQPVELEQADVFHLKGLGGNGLKGYPVTRFARESMGVAMAAEKFGAALFGNGVQPGGTLEHPGKLSGEAQKRLIQSIEARHKGADKALKLMVLEEGMKFNKLTIPPEEAQFLETRQFHIPEVCRWFRVQPHKVMDLSRATFSNIEHQSIEHVTDTLRPWLIRLEQEANRKLIRPAERGTVYTEHLVDALLRGDALSRSQALEVQWRNGALTVDEWRAIENRNPLPGGLGSRHYVPMNMVPADKVDEVIAQKNTPAPPGGAAGDALSRHLAGVRATLGDAAAAQEERRLAKLITENLDGN